MCVFCFLAFNPPRTLWWNVSALWTILAQLPGSEWADLAKNTEELCMIPLYTMGSTYPHEQFSEREMTIFTYVSKSFSFNLWFFVEDVFFSDFSTNQWDSTLRNSLKNSPSGIWTFDRCSCSNGCWECGRWIGPGNSIFQWNLSLKPWGGWTTDYPLVN